MIYWQVSKFLDKVNSFSDLTLSSVLFFCLMIPKTSRLGVIAIACADWKFL